MLKVIPMPKLRRQYKEMLRRRALRRKVAAYILIAVFFAAVFRLSWQGGWMIGTWIVENFLYGR